MLTRGLIGVIFPVAILTLFVLATRGWNRRLGDTRKHSFEVPGDPSSSAFLVAAALYPIGLLVFHAMSPRMERAQLAEAAPVD